MNVPLGGFWSVPGGQVESDETESEAAIREFFEETQITLNIFKLELMDTFPAKDGGKALGTFYLYQYSGGKRFEPILDEEHTEWGYFTKNKLPIPIQSSLVRIIKSY